MYSYVFTGSLIIRSVFDTAADAGRLVQGIPSTAGSLAAPAGAPGGPRMIHPLPRAPPCTAQGWPQPLPTLFVGDAPERCQSLLYSCQNRATVPLSSPSGVQGGWKAVPPPFYLLSNPRRTSHARRKSTQRLFAEMIAGLSCFGGGSTWEV